MFVELLKEFMGRKVGERIHVSADDAAALCAQGIAKAVTDDLITPAVSKALESAFGKFSDAMNLIVEKNLKAFADAQAQSHKHAVPAFFGTNGHGDPKKNFGDWLLHVAKNDEAYLEKTYGSVRNKARWPRAVASPAATWCRPSFLPACWNSWARNPSRAVLHTTAGDSVWSSARILLGGKIIEDELPGVQRGSN